MRFKRTRKNQKGVTLIELMMAVGLFLIGMQALLSINAQGIVEAKRAEYVYTAYNLAKNHLERLKAGAFTDLATANETSTQINADGDPDASGQFYRTTAAAIYNGNANLMQVTVSVYYTLKGVQSARPMQISDVIYNG